MRLVETQRALLEVVRGQRSAEGLAERLGQPTARVALYRDFVRGHVTGILAKLFPKALELVVDRAAIEEAFYREHAPRHRDLNLAGEPFPAFLDRAGQGFAAAVAQLEWEIFAAALHPAELVSHGVCLNPTLSLFEQHFPAVQYLAQGGPPPVERLTPPQVVMVFRRPSNEVAYRVLDEVSARVLTCLESGATPADEDLERGLERGFLLGRA